MKKEFLYNKEAAETIGKERKRKLEIVDKLNNNSVGSKDLNGNTLDNNWFRYI
jgi:hypothetical protein